MKQDGVAMMLEATLGDGSLSIGRVTGYVESLSLSATAVSNPFQSLTCSPLITSQFHTAQCALNLFFLYGFRKVHN
jgi:hypothetical protein